MASDRCEQTLPPPHRETPQTVSQFVEGVLSAKEPAEALAAIADWWRVARGATVGLGIAPNLERSGWLVVATDEGTPEVEPVPHCLLNRSRSVRDAVSLRLSPGVRTTWHPLVSDGRNLGGLAIAEQPGIDLDPVSSDWVAITATLVADALGRQERLQQEKLASLAEFAAGAGHEINNPLGSILGRVQLLSREESNPERRRLLATIGSQALRVRDMIGDVMLFARPPALCATEVSLPQLVDAAISKFESELRLQGIEVVVEHQRDLTLRADPALVAVVIGELLRNALQATPRESRVQITTRRSGDFQRSLAVLEISDSGPGLSDTDCRHLFDPFYSGRQAGRGLGFGLSKCWRIVTAHGGCIHGINTDPGFRMTVHWPIA